MAAKKSGGKKATGRARRESSARKKASARRFDTGSVRESGLALVAAVVSDGEG